ncbi:MAG: hypothetical protein V1921_06685 [Candidatus Altiarchaeota archaeon]
MTGMKVIKLKLEGDGSETLPSLKGDPVEAAIRTFEEITYVDPLVEEAYEKMLKSTSRINADSRQLQTIVEILEERYCSTVSRPAADDERTKAGLYVTALAQNSKTDKFNITSNKKLNYVGFKLKEGKEITVEGDVWVGAGQWLDGGKLTINGSAGYHLGHNMAGGSIHVTKDAGEGAGWEMTGGGINIGGNAGNRTGWEMAGGNIRVDGSVGDETGRNMVGGEILVEKDAGNMTGKGMSGGMLTVIGNAGDKTGLQMERGELRIGGKSGKETGEEMWGGRITVLGEIEGIAEKKHSGEIWQKGTKVWPE